MKSYLAFVLLIFASYSCAAGPYGQVGKAAQIQEPVPKWPTTDRQYTIGPIGAKTLSLQASNTYRFCSIDAKGYLPPSQPKGYDGVVIFGEPGEASITINMEMLGGGVTINGKPAAVIKGADNPITKNDPEFTSWRVLPPTLGCIDFTGMKSISVYLACDPKLPASLKPGVPANACSLDDGFRFAHIWLANTDVLEKHKAPFANAFAFPWLNGQKYVIPNYQLVERSQQAKYEICIGGTAAIQIKSSKDTDYQTVTLQGCDTFNVIGIRLPNIHVVGTYREVK